MIKQFRLLKRKNNETLTAYAFLVPWIVGFICFSGFPIIVSFGLSFTEWNMMGVPKFVGLGNYRQMFTQSSEFMNSLWVTVVYTFASVFFTMLWALLLAMLLTKRTKLSGVFQFFYFIPAVIPTISLAFVFQIIFNQHTGVFNYLLSVLGSSQQPNWLFDESLVMPTVVFITIYTYSTGQMMLIFKSSILEVPRELYEAAAIDGASAWRNFVSITLPSISPIILFNMVVASINSLNTSFNLLQPLTNGGPNDATNVLSLSIYSHAFGNYRMGYASALAVILFLLAALLARLEFFIFKKWVYYAE
jgi:multiple sugar transport system permease protein